MSNAPAKTGTTAGRSVRALGTLLFNGGLIAGALAIYYFVVLDKQQTFRTERSFRALGEIGVQIDNGLGRIGAAFDSSPSIEAYGQGADSSGTKSSAEARAAAFEKRIAVDGLKVLPLSAAAIDQHCTPDPTAHPASAAGSRQSSKRILATADEAALELEAWSCGNSGPAAEAATASGKSGLSFTLPLNRLLDSGDVLAEFEHVAVVSPVGSVLSLSSRHEAVHTEATVHEEIVDRLELRDLRDLLARAQIEHLRSMSGSVTAEAGAQLPDDLAKTLALQAPATEVAVPYQTGGRRYRAFIAPYVPPPGYVIDGCKQGTESCRSLLLLGLRQESALDSARARLGAGFNWYLVLLSIAAIALVPLLRLLMLEPHDAVSPGHERLVMSSWLVLPALLMLGALSVLAQRSMADWADYGAQRYAVQLRGALEDEFRALLAIMDGQAPVFAGPALRPDAGPGPRPIACASGKAADAEARGKSERSRMRESWQLIPSDTSRLPVAKSVFKVEANGWLELPTLTPFDCAYDQKKLDLNSRAYFSVLRDGHGWARPDDAAGGYVAQRLFNKVYGDKLLQLAAPLADSGQAFAGVIAADTHFYAATAALLPPGYEFAIFDRDTGTVVLHSDDRRSLVENFYTEAQRAPGLMGAIRAGVAGSHRLEYFGVDQRVYYLPLRFAPWGIAVLHRSDIGGGMVLGAGLTALVSYTAALFAASIVAAFLLLPGRHHLAWVRPQWRLRRAYPVFALLLTASLLVQVSVFMNLTGTALALVLLLGVISLLASASALLSPNPYAGNRPRRYRFRLAMACDALVALVLLGQALGAEGTSPPWTALGLLALAAHAALLLRSRRQVQAQPAVTGDLWRADSPVCLARGGVGTARARQLYLLCTGLLAVQLYALPIAGFFLRALGVEQEAALRVGFERTAASLARREQAIEADLRRYAALPQTRARYPSAMVAARQQPAPGFAYSESSGYEFTLLDERPAGAAPGSESAPLDARHWSASRGLARDPLVLWFWDLLALADGDRSYAAGLMDLEADPACPGEPATERRDQLSTWPRSTGPDAVRRAACPSHQPQQRLWMHFPPRWDAHLFSRPPGEAPERPLSWNGLVLLLLLGGLGGFAWLSAMVSRRLLGLDLVRPPTGVATLAGLEADAQPQRHQLLMGSAGTVQDAELFRRLYPDVVVAGRIDLAAGDLKLSPTTGDWLLSGFDTATLDAKRRLEVLDFLEPLMTREGPRLYLLCAVDPLHRMANPEEYGAAAGELSEHELARWCDLLVGLRRRWLVLPPAPVQPLEPADRAALEAVIAFECPPTWPRLRLAREALLQQLEAGWIRTPEDVRQLLLVHAQAEFQRMWLICSTDERLALHHLAKGRHLNPLDSSVIHSLQWKGLIALRPDPQLASDSLRQFVLGAETPELFAQWSAEASRGAWQVVRVPLLILLLLLLGWASYSAGEAFQAAGAVLAGGLALLGKIMDSAKFVRGSGDAGK